MSLVRAALVVAGLGGIALVAGFGVFAVNILDATPPPDPRAEGIVVFTGGTARIDGALHLLAEGRASRLLISGVNPAVSRQALAESVGKELDAALDCCVDLGREAQDTIGNATETREWAEAKGFRSLIVVTSDYHMPRSMAELAEAMPEVTLIPYPVTNPDLHLDDWWNRASAFGLLTREYGKYLLAAARLHLSSPPAAREASARTGS